MNSVDKAVDTIANCIIKAIDVRMRQKDNNTKNPIATIKEVLTNNNYRIEIYGSSACRKSSAIAGLFALNMV